MALKVLNLLQSFYTEERVIQITDFQNPDQPRTPMTINEETATGEVVNNITLGEYDVAITTAPSRDTFNDSQFAEAISLRTAGVQVPDDAIIEYSHLAQKDELAKRVREMMGQGEPTEEEMQMQQMVQQLEIKQLQATVGNLEADIMHKQTQAQLNQAKTQDIMIDDQFDVKKLQAEMMSKREDLMFDVQKLQAELISKREELMTKLEIAKIAARSHANNITH
jgi:hypothetical protein